MNKKTFGLASAALATSITLATGCAPKNGLERAESVPQTDLQKESYAIGMNVGKNIANSKLEFDRAYFNAGFYDAIDGEQRMTDEDMMATLTALQQKSVQKAQEESAKLSEANIKAAEAFLAANQSKEGVVTLESGLQYRVINAADGDKPAADDVVTVHYEGRLEDGTVFDSSYNRGEPATFPLNGVIAGWTEAVQLMSPGAKWELFIPPALGYGDRAVGQHIKPNSLLIFDVELVSIGEDEPAATE